MLITFALYIFVIISIGIFSCLYTKNLQDYMLAGRNLNGTMTALGAGAADMSGWLMLVLPGLIFTYGLQRVWVPIGLVIGAYLNWHFIAKRLRIYTEILNNALTIPEYIHNRFVDKNGAMRFCIAIVVLIFFTVYAASSFQAAATILEFSFNCTYTQGLLIGAIIILCYTLLGGFLAISWIDLFQGGMMLLALIIIPVVIFSGNNFTFMPEILLGNYLDFTYDITWVQLLSYLSWGLGYCGQLHILVRFMAIANPAKITKAKYICITWMILALGGAVFTGLFAVGVSNTHAIADPNTTFLVLAKNILNPYVAGIVIAAALSAVMSTAAALLLASASALTSDLYAGFFRKVASRKELMVVARLSVLGVAIIAVAIVLLGNNSILYLVRYAWDGLGASFGPVILLSLFWRRITLLGAVIGMLTGTIVVVLWEFVNYEIHAIIPAFFMAIIMIVITSLLDKRPSSKIIKDFVKMLAIVKQY